MQDPFKLPQFPTLFTEEDTERMQSLEALQQQQLQHYEQHFTGDAWQSKAVWERAWRTIGGATFLDRPRWLGDRTYGFSGAQHDRYMFDVETELQELKRQQRIALELPAMLDTALFMYALGEPTYEEAYLYDMFPALNPNAPLHKRLQLNADERSWLQEWLEGLKNVPPDRAIDYLNKPYTADHEAEFMSKLSEALRLPSAKQLTPAQILSTVAFSKDTDEIRAALMTAYPPTAEDPNAAFVSEQQNLMTQEMRDFGITPTGNWLEDLKALEESKKQRAQQAGEPISIADPDTGVEYEALLVNESDVYIENEIGRELVGKYDIETQTYMPLSEEELFDAIDQLSFQLTNPETGEEIDAALKMSDGSVWVDGRQVGQINDKGDFVPKDAQWHQHALYYVAKALPYAFWPLTVMGVFPKILGKHIFGDFITYRTSEERERGDWQQGRTDELTREIQTELFGRQLRGFDTIPPDKMEEYALRLGEIEDKVSAEYQDLFGRPTDMELLAARADEIIEEHGVSDYAAWEFARYEAVNEQYDAVPWWGQLLYELPGWLILGRAGVLGAPTKVFQAAGKALRGPQGLPAGLVTSWRPPGAAASAALHSARAVLAPTYGVQWVVGMATKPLFSRLYNVWKGISRRYGNLLYDRHPYGKGAAWAFEGKNTPEYKLWRDLTYKRLHKPPEYTDELWERVMGAELEREMLRNPKFAEGIVRLQMAVAKAGGLPYQDYQAMHTIIRTTEPIIHANPDTANVVSRAIKQATEQGASGQAVTPQMLAQLTPDGVKLAVPQQLVNKLVQMGWEAGTIIQMTPEEAWSTLISGREPVDPRAIQIIGDKVIRADRLTAQERMLYDAHVGAVNAHITSKAREAGVNVAGKEGEANVAEWLGQQRAKAAVEPTAPVVTPQEAVPTPTEVKMPVDKERIAWLNGQINASKLELAALRVEQALLRGQLDRLPPHEAQAGLAQLSDLTAQSQLVNDRIASMQAEIKAGTAAPQPAKPRKVVSPAERAYQKEIKAAKAAELPKESVPKPPEHIEAKAAQMQEKINETVPPPPAEPTEDLMTRAVNTLSKDEKMKSGVDDLVRRLKVVKVDNLTDYHQSLAKQLLQGAETNFAEGALDRTPLIDRTVKELNELLGEIETFAPPEGLIGDIQTLPFDELTVKDLYDLVRELEKPTAPPSSVLTAIEPGAKTEDIVRQLGDKLGGIPPKIPSAAVPAEDAWDRFAGKLGGVFARSIRMERLIESWDKFEEIKKLPAGLFNKYIWKPVTRATNQKMSIRGDEIRGLQDVVRGEGIDLGQLWSKRVSMLPDKPDMKFTGSDRIGIYLINQTRQGQIHLEFGNGLTPGDVAYLISQMTPEEMAVAKYLEQSLARLHPIVNATHEAVKGRPLGHREHYFPLKVKSGVSSEISLERQMAIDQWLRLQSNSAMHKIHKGFTKQRLAAAFNEVETDALLVYLNYLDAATHYAAFAGVVRDLQAITKSPEFKRAFLKGQNKAKYEVLQKWIQDIAQTNPLMPANYFEGVMRSARGNIVTSLLGLNITTALKQFASFSAGMAELGVPATLKGLFQYMRYPSYTHELQRELSPEIYHRTMEREIAEGRLGKNIANRIMEKKTKREIFMFMTLFMDKLAVNSIWQGAFDYYLGQYPDATPEQAAEFATLQIRRHQPYFTIKDIPELYKSGELAKGMLMFTNQLNQYWNYYLFDIVGKAKAGTITPQEVMQRILFTFIVPGLVIGAINRSRPAENAEEFAKDMASQFLAPIPLFGGGFASVVRGAYQDSGIVSTQLVWSSVKMFEQLMKDDKEWEKVAMAGAELGAYVAGVPFSQPRRTITGAYDLAVGKTDDWGRLIWSEHARKQLAGIPDTLNVALRQLDEKEAQLGESIDGRWYTLGRYGNEASRELRESGLPIQRLLLEGGALTNLQRFRLLCETEWEEYQKIPVSSDRIEYRRDNPTVDAALFFWEEVSTLRSKDAATIVMYWFKEFEVIQNDNWHWLDSPEPPDYVKALYDYHLYVRETGGG